jgi:hypothetical protein
MEKINTEASAWSEFKNPEGRAYFYNSKTMESTWDKPIVLSDVIGMENNIASILVFCYEIISFRCAKST